jgi:hypothetical protein
VEAMSTVDRIEDPWFVSGMMDGLCALILFAMMANCDYCQRCREQHFRWKLEQEWKT